MTSNGRRQTEPQIAACSQHGQSFKDFYLEAVCIHYSEMSYMHWIASVAPLTVHNLAKIKIEICWRRLGRLGQIRPKLGHFAFPSASVQRPRGPVHHRKTTLTLSAAQACCGYDPPAGPEREWQRRARSHQPLEGPCSTSHRNALAV